MEAKSKSLNQTINKMCTRRNVIAEIRALSGITIENENIENNTSFRNVHKPVHNPPLRARSNSDVTFACDLHPEVM